MVCFVFTDWALGIYNIRLKMKGKFKEEARDLLIERYRIPRSLVRLQSITHINIERTEYYIYII